MPQRRNATVAIVTYVSASNLILLRNIGARGGRRTAACAARLAVRDSVIVLAPCLLIYFALGAANAGRLYLSARAVSLNSVTAAARASALATSRA